MTEIKSTDDKKVCAVHTIPEIYNPSISYRKKCEIMSQLCTVYAEHKGVELTELQLYLFNKLHVDFKKLDDNPVGMLLLYEYLYFQRPQVCKH